MTELTREQVQALLEGITPGDWRVRGTQEETTIGGFTVVGPFEGPSLGYLARTSDAEIIAASPALARQLLAMMDERDGLREEVEQLRREAGYVEIKAENNYIGNDPEEHAAWKARMEALAGQEGRKSAE